MPPVQSRLAAAALAAAALAAAPVHAQSIGSAAPVIGAEAGHSENGALDFARKAGQADEFERRSSRLALERATSPAVRAFAQRMIDDHTMTTEQVMAAGAQAGLKVDKPAAMDDAQITTLRHLEAQHGPGFDRAYVDAQMRAHAEALALAEGYARNGATPPMVATARQLAGVIRTHMDMLRDLRAQLG